MEQKVNKVLIIDDEAALLLSIRAYLEDSGFEVFSAQNGIDGLKAYAEHQPDLVLTDIHMPNMSGLEVLNTIAKQDADAPVIVISGAGELNDAIEALRLGAWDFITKPISDLKVLEHAVNKALQSKKLIAENKLYAQRIEQNLKILKEDQAAGRTVQMSLLPQGKLAAQDYTFDYRILPSLELSGDFAEYFHVADSYYVAYLADVSGHGASSAFITVLLKSLISQYVAHYKINSNDSILIPKKMLQILSNEIFAAKLNKYLTIIYCVINVTSNELRYAIGGHYPNPILLQNDGIAIYLEGSGYPIGIKQNAEYIEYNLILKAQERIFLFSDGIMEALLPGVSLVEKDVALLDIVKRSNGNIAAILDLCNTSTTEQKSQVDDITILSITKD
jgi:serine phosphatase RsbU (regulator of sigma subunit)